MKNLTNYEIYKEFLQKIVPKTRVLFNLTKKYIHGKLSLHDVVGYLEPFLVYTDDLTFMQYKEIDEFLQLKISEYNKNFKEREKEFSLFKKKIMNTGYNASANRVLSLITNRQLNVNVFNDSYEYDSGLRMTNSELLWKMKTTDFSKIFDNALALENIATMLPENIGSIR